MNHTQHRLKGVLFAIIGATLWGLGGTVSDLLFNQRDIEVDWYVTVRLLISGIFLLSLYKLLHPKQSMFIVLRSSKQLLICLYTV